MIKKIGQTKRNFVEDDLIAEDNDFEIALKRKCILKRDKSVIKLMQMSKEAGIIKERKRIIKLFDYEVNNNFVSFETLRKLVDLRFSLEKIK